MNFCKNIVLNIISFIKMQFKGHPHSQWMLQNFDEIKTMTFDLSYILAPINCAVQ